MDHDLVARLALAEALVDPVLVAGPHELGGDLGREPIAPDPADHLVHAEVDQGRLCPMHSAELLTLEPDLVDNRPSRSTFDQSARLLH
ncbi:hypothetical protein [Streptomyces coeruleorubidus]|uniref:hypothetical protein n=1 Tax=Streptomyces coeruleorubidus TaxID=116188 RepID=UPI0036632058